MENYYCDQTIINSLPEGLPVLLQQNMRKAIFYDSIEALSCVNIQSLASEEAKQLIASLIVFNYLSYKDISGAVGVYSQLDEDRIFPLRFMWAKAAAMQVFL